MTIRKETKTFTVYKFEDLSEEGKEKALQQERGATNESMNLDFTIEESIEDLKELGIEEPKIFYSGFNSQGDGACFEFCNIDFEKFLTKNKIKSKFKLLIKYQGAITFRGEQSGRYYHENSVDNFQEISSHLGCNDMHYSRVFDALEKQLEAFGEWFEGWRVEKCKEIYKDLENDNDYQLSDDNLKDNIIANDYDFNQDGTTY